MTADRAFVASVASALAAQADPARAVGQQAYMKSEMPYYGVPMPGVDRVVRERAAAWAPTRSVWEATLRQLWDEASHREERYVVLGLARHRQAREWQDPPMIALYEHWVHTGAWWDFVDVIAAHLVGQVLLRHRTQVSPVIRTWADDQDLWLRRTAVLSQLRHGVETDTDLLRDCIERNLGDQSFWLRKSIGWALREFARTNPGWVREQVESWGSALSGLSRREALKHLG